MPRPQFAHNLSVSNNSHCKLHFWKLKVILTRNFVRPFPVFPESPRCCFPRDLGAIGLTTKCAQMHTQRHSERRLKCVCSGKTGFQIVNIFFNSIK